ncbi:uncharacterized protein LOC101849297 [Aplysia californica]|uniref:Uncharacterized protein LOC101849297 n=1 Tax=Aplysia californica TaxID=6500 RepID=A0ABM0JTC0_APLCA|nr:uncharacterized protein LOC101849297 [Aplysia californica]XP_005101007.1 uncharacterized protein LOC101849297 [Aplysia californica]
MEVMHNSSDRNQPLNSKSLDTTPDVAGLSTVASTKGTKGMVYQQCSDPLDKRISGLKEPPAVFDHQYASEKQSKEKTFVSEDMELFDELQTGHDTTGQRTEQAMSSEKENSTHLENDQSSSNGTYPMVTKRFRTLVKRKSMFDGLNFQKDDVNQASENTEMNPSGWKCGYCGLTFMGEKDIVTHLKKHEGLTPKENANKTFNSKYSATQIEEQISHGINNKECEKSKVNKNHCQLLPIYNGAISISSQINRRRGSRVPNSIEMVNVSIKSKSQTSGPMASVGKRNAKKKLGDDFIVPQSRSKHKQSPPIEIGAQEKSPVKVKSKVSAERKKKTSSCSTGNGGEDKKLQFRTVSSKSRLFGKQERQIDEDKSLLLKCPQCCCCFLRNESYSEHMMQHNCSMPYQCLQCELKFSHFQGLKSHIENHECKFSVPSTFSCGMCKSQFRDMPELQEHKTKCEHSKNQSDQDTVSSKNRFPLALRRHISKQVGNKEKNLHKCFPCKRTFKDRRLLFIHKKRHPNAYKPFKCDICSQSFAVKKWLDNHAQRHVVERKFPCDICGKKYLTKGDAVMHKRRHTLDRKFHCDICQKNFVYRSELNSHLKKHQGVKLPKNIACDTCGKKFATRRDLQRHTTVHTGEQPYECPLCGKKFSQEVNMQIHIKIHTNIRPHKCGECEKSFITKSKLLRHQVIHTKPKASLPKPYKCLLCPRQYTAENSLIRHLKSHRESPGTVTSVTEVLNKAMEDSKKKDGITSGSVLASLIDQAIRDAKIISKKGKEKSTAPERSMAEIIDQAIHNSKAVSLGTQTPILVKDANKFSKPKGGLSKPIESISESNLAKHPKQSKQLSSVQTVIVKPKGTVVNYGPTDHRKFHQNPTVLQQIKLNADSVRCIPMQEIHHQNLNGRGKLLSNNMTVIGPNQTQFLVHSPLQTPDSRTNIPVSHVASSSKQYDAVPSVLKTSFIEATDLPTTSKQVYSSEVQILERTPHLTAGFEPHKVKNAHSLSPDFNNGNHFIILPTKQEPVSHHIPVQPQSEDTKYFILQTDTQGRTIVLQTPVISVDPGDQITETQFSHFQGAPGPVNNLPSVTHLVENRIESPQHVSFLNKRLHTLVPDPTVIQEHSKIESVESAFVNQDIVPGEETGEVYSYPTVPITEHLDGNVEFTVAEVPHLDSSQNIFYSGQELIVSRDASGQELIISREEVEDPDTLMEIPTEFVTDGLDAKSISQDSTSFYTVDTSGALETVAALGIAPSLSDSMAGPSFDNEGSHILCNVPSSVITDAQFLEQEILQALEKRICPSEHDGSNEDIVLADTQDTFHV